MTACEGSLDRQITMRDTQEEWRPECPSSGNVLLGGGVAVEVVELLPLRPPGATVSPPIDSSDQTGGGITVGKTSAGGTVASVVGVLTGIGGGIQGSGCDPKGTKVAEVFRLNPMFPGGVFGGVENAREERRGILKPGGEEFVGGESSSDCCRVMGGAAPGGRGPWARK